MRYRVAIELGSVYRVVTLPYEPAQKTFYKKPKRRESEVLIRWPGSRKRLRDLVLANMVGDSPVFATFTLSKDYSGISRVQMSKRFEKFWCALRYQYGSHLRYVLAEERQKRGALHLHVLIWGLPHSAILSEGCFGVGRRNTHYFLDWAQKEGYTSADFSTERGMAKLWGYGYVDLIPTNGSIKLASYFSKYFTKTVNLYRNKHGYAQKGERLYRASRNALRPVRWSGHAAEVFIGMYPSLQLIRRSQVLIPIFGSEPVDVEEFLK